MVYDVSSHNNGQQGMTLINYLRYILIFILKKENISYPLAFHKRITVIEHHSRTANIFRPPTISYQRTSAWHNQTPDIRLSDLSEKCRQSPTNPYHVSIYAQLSCVYQPQFLFVCLGGAGLVLFYFFIAPISIYVAVKRLIKHIFSYIFSWLW